MTCPIALRLACLVSPRLRPAAREASPGSAHRRADRSIHRAPLVPERNPVHRTVRLLRDAGRRRQPGRFQRRHRRCALRGQHEARRRAGPPLPRLRGGAAADSGADPCHRAGQCLRWPVGGPGGRRQWRRLRRLRGGSPVLEHAGADRCGQGDGLPRRAEPAVPSDVRALLPRLRPRTSCSDGRSPRPATSTATVTTTCWSARRAMPRGDSPTVVPCGCFTGGRPAWRQRRRARGSDPRRTGVSGRRSRPPATSTATAMPTSSSARRRWTPDSRTMAQPTCT